MVYKNEVIICGNSFEINLVSDVAVFLSLDQIKLASAILCEIDIPSSAIQNSSYWEKSFPYSRFNSLKDDAEFEMSDFYRDSGIDTSEIRSTVLSLRSQFQVFINFIDVFLVNFIIYRVHIQ